MFGKQARDASMDFGSFLHQSANAVKDEYKSMYSGFKQDMANKSLAKRQNIIKQNEVNSQLEHEAWLADRAEGAPKNWGEALKSAGGGNGAAWRVGSGAVAGAVVGGGLDYAQGNDGILDGTAIGAASGALIGAGSFARSVHKLKVGKYTPTVDGGVSYVNKNNTNTGRHQRSSGIGPRERQKTPNDFNK